MKHWGSFPRWSRVWLPGSYGRLVAAALSELQELEVFLARNLYSWARPDARVELGGLVSDLVDRVSLASEGAVVTNIRAVLSGHTYSRATAPNQCSAPTMPAAWMGSPVLTFAASAVNRYTSVAPAAAWNLCHNGSGMEAVVVASMTSLATLSALLASTDSGIHNGLQLYVGASSGVTNAGVYKVSSTVVNTTPAGGAVAAGVPTYVSIAHGTSSSPQWTKRVKTAAVTGTYIGPAGTGDAKEPLTIGALNTAGLFAANMEFADLLVAPSDSDIVRTAYRRYIELRYAGAIAA